MILASEPRPGCITFVRVRCRRDDPADIVFPFFLFHRRRRDPAVVRAGPKAWGSSRWRQLLATSLFRSAALLLILGVIELNSDEDHTGAAESGALFAAICVILAWCVLPACARLERGVLLTLKTVGVLGLIVSAGDLPARAPYRRGAVSGNLRESGSGWRRLVGDPLGLIGWVGPDRCPGDSGTGQASRMADGRAGDS